MSSKTQQTLHSSVRTRIAPSPTGIAHIGTAYIALFNYAFAKQHNGQFIVRVEDTDRQRFVEGAEQVIFDALNWLEITHDEGPDIGGPFGPYRQSERLEIYKQYAEQLIKQGDAYYCFCTPQRLNEMRKAQQKAGELPMYDGLCRDLDPAEAAVRAKSEPHVVRMKMPKQGTTSWNDLIRDEISFENKLVDDQVIMKSDGYPTYHLAVVVDDHLMQISHVLRGEEWISSTPKHLQLYRMLGWEPPVFAHMPLLRNPDHSKFSKRKNDVSIPSYREKGYLPEALRNYLSLLGWSHPNREEIFDLENFVKHFTITTMQKTGPVFDVPKLNWMNGRYIREKVSEAELMQQLEPFLPADLPRQQFPQMLRLLRDRVVVLSEFEELSSFFYRTPRLERSLFEKLKYSNELTGYLRSVIDALKTLESDNWTVELLEKTLTELQIKHEFDKKTLFMGVRIAVSGRSATPPLFEMLDLLGKDITLDRLNSAVTLLSSPIES